MSDEQSTRHDDRVQVWRLSLHLLQSVNESDVEGVQGIWALDGTLMPPHHPAVTGRDAITQFFVELFQRGRFAFEFTNSRIAVTGSVAIEQVQYTATFFPVDGGTPINDKGKGLHVFRRQPDGGWQLDLDIWNTDNPRS